MTNLWSSIVTLVSGTKFCAWHTFSFCFIFLWSSIRFSLLVFSYGWHTICKWPTFDLLLWPWPWSQELSFMTHLLMLLTLSVKFIRFSLLVLNGGWHTICMWQTFDLPLWPWSWEPKFYAWYTFSFCFTRFLDDKLFDFRYWPWPWSWEHKFCAPNTVSFFFIFLQSLITFPSLVFELWLTHNL